MNSLETSLLAYELTHTVQQLSPDKWKSTLKQQEAWSEMIEKNSTIDGEVDELKMKDYQRTYRYGISTNILFLGEIRGIREHPSKYIGQENNLQFPKGLGTTDNRADINRYIIAEKMKRMKEMKLINDKN